MKRVLSALVVVACALAIVAGASPGEASPRVLVIHGHGFGHGYGMGQWGARAMAQRGASWQGIVRHYYRGARIAQRSPSVGIRVLLDASRAQTFTGRSLTARAGGGTIDARWIRARRPADAILVETARDRDGPWRRAAAGARVTLRARGPVWLARAGDGLTAYPGSIVVRRAGRGIAVVERVRLERYLTGVVPREMPASWNMEALRAQAVAARSYALRVRRVARANGSPHDICATTACQAFDGVARRRAPGAPIEPLTHPRSSRAVRDTAGRVLVWRGEPILAQYSSSSGGWTDRGAFPYLRPVPDPGDRFSPFHAWTERLDVARVESAWSVGRLESVRVTRRSGRGDWGGRARRVAIVGSRRTVTVDGPDFASELGLRSDWFRVTVGRAPRWDGRFGRDLGYGMRNDDVRALQVRLRRDRAFPQDAPVTGYFGPITRAAVRRWQRAHDISATGFVGPISRARLNGERYRFTDDLGYGMRDPAVRELMHRLKNEGFLARSVPGGERFGDRLREAVRRYQRARGIPPTGYVGPMTRRALNR